MKNRGGIEPSDGRKIRLPLFNNIVTILLTAMVSIVFVLVIFSVARYVARAQIELQTVAVLMIS